MQRLTAVEIPDTYDWPPRLWPTLFDSPLTDYVVIGAIALASFGGTAACVARQRHGGREAVPSAQRDGLWNRLVSLFRFPCPTSSATRVQVWLDLKSNGLPVLTIGVVLAMVILLVSAASGPIDAAFSDEIRVHLSCSNRDCFYVRVWPVLFAPLSLFIVLLLGGNAFGIRQRRGRADISAFEATHPHGTAQLATLKVLVKSGCVLAALVVVGVSVWTSISLLGDAVFIQMWSVPPSSRLPAIRGAVAALTGYEQLSLVVVAAVGVVVRVAAFAVLRALWTRYSRRANIAGSLLLLYGLVLGLLALAGQRGFGPEISLGAILRATSWMAASAIVFTTGYLLWRGFAERHENGTYGRSRLRLTRTWPIHDELLTYAQHRVDTVADVRTDNRQVDRVRMSWRALALPLFLVLGLGFGDGSRLPPPPQGLDLYMPVPDDNPPTRERVALGRRLFSDKRLSKDRSLACASCHDAARAFSSPARVAVGVLGRAGRRNAPALVNRGYGRAFFWDGRASTLEAQVLEPITNPDELGMTLAEAASRVGLDQSTIAKSLASYVRSIRSGSSRFDRYVAGRSSALSDEEKTGLQVFRGKGNCVACHTGPSFTDEAFHNTGIAWRDGTLVDEGRFDVSRNTKDHGAFKTPTLREVARTAPYMHDGSLATLEEVIDFYSQGGRSNPALDPDIRPRNFTIEQKKALLAFLQTLTGDLREGWK